VTHPFDTGDRCFIGAENLVVKRMGIWSTNFVRVDGTEAYYYSQFRLSALSLAARLSADLTLLFSAPDSVLFSMLITNGTLRLQLEGEPQQDTDELDLLRLQFDEVDPCLKT
jgi:hypothetical protein